MSAFGTGRFPSTTASLRAELDAAMAELDDHLGKAFATPHTTAWSEAMRHCMVGEGVEPSKAAHLSSHAAEIAGHAHRTAVLLRSYLEEFRGYVSRIDNAVTDARLDGGTGGTFRVDA